MRSIKEIASEIETDWTKVNFAALPYLDAMHSLDSVSDSYGLDSGQSVVAYFLANAGTWRGDRARALKAELKAML
tara:strand:- start:1409 stop:1633 length:225 start_codon:yes stop_codon:yes gene_type:complete